MDYWIGFGLLFVVPLLVWPFGVTGFELPKVIAVYLLACVWGVVKLSREWRTWGAWGGGRYQLYWLLGALLVWQSVRWGMGEIWWGNAYRMQGAGLLVVFMVVGVMAGRVREWRWNRWGVGVCLLILILGIGVMGADMSGRAISSLGEPNNLAVAVLAMYPVVMGRSHTRWVWVALAGAMVFLTGSRSGAIGWGLQIMMMLGWRRGWSVRRGVGLVSVLLVLAMGLAYVENTGLFEVRSEIWRIGYLAGWRYPWSGWGWGRTITAYREVSRELNSNLQYIVVDSAHNLLLDWWVQGGVVGVVVVVAVTFGMMRWMIGEERRMELLSWVGVASVAMFNPLGVSGLVWLWWLWGRGLGLGGERALTNARKMSSNDLV